MRGWYYRYSHLSAINTPIRPGEMVRAGQRIGTVGKEGGSGGWSHLHFEIKSLQPSGKWGTQDGYAFLWQAYREQYAPKILAVARPRHLVLTGEQVMLDGSRSWAAAGVAAHEWSLSNGVKAAGSRVKRVYDKPGTFSEILTVTDRRGNIDVDFAIVRVVDRSNPDQNPPGIHPVYYPTFGLQTGDPITFKVRARGTTEGVDVWDFGDGSPPVTVRSNVTSATHAPDGYATTIHRYRKPGRHIATVRRTTSRGTATSHLLVVIE